MITGQGIESVAATILAQKPLKKDYIADTRAIRFTEQGLVRLNVSGGQCDFYTPTLHCIRQIGDRVGIPAKYVDRLASEAPALLAHNVNHWFAAKPEKRMLRTLQNGSNVARAFLSDRYRPLDNYDIAQHVLPRLGERGCEIKSAAITDTRLYVQAILPGTARDIKTLKVNDTVCSGLVLSNSEVGMGRLQIEHLVYTLRCTNGMIGQNVVRASHVGKNNSRGLEIDSAAEFLSDESRQADDKAFWLKVRDMVKHALSDEMFNAACDRLQATAEVEIEKPVELVSEVMAEKFLWSENEAGSILDHLIKGGDISQYGLLNAVTRSAQDCEDYDRAIELERQGGMIMELKAHDFRLN